MHIHIPDSIPARFLPRNKTANLILGAMMVVGLVAFVLRLQSDATSAWTSYVSNWLFFSSLAMGAVMFAGATTVVKAKWNWSLRRVSVAFAAFLPIAFLLMLPMFMAGSDFFPWIDLMATDPLVQKKAAYLNMPFLIARNVVGAAILFGVAVYFAWLTVRPDMGRLDESQLDEGQKAWRERLMAGWRGQEVEEQSSWERISRLAPAMGLLYGLIMAFFAYDWAMSLEPHWFSTLFGGWFFMGAFWGGIAVTAFTGMWLRSKDADVSKFIGMQQRHDIGKLAFAFTVFWTYLFWAQYIVIWYGKLPWEQLYIVKRSGEGWGTYSAVIIILCFITPFVGLIGRKPKMNPTMLRTLTGIILFGLWCERYWLVTPSLIDHYSSTNMTYQLLIGLGFLGAFMASVRWALSTFPVVQMWQPPQNPEMVEAEVAHHG